MLVLQLLALGILLHESVYLSSRGGAHWRDNCAPVLGLRLTATQTVLVHCANVLASAVLLLQPLAWFAPLTSLLSLTLLIAGFPRRLPNHLIVAWFILAAFALAYGLNAVSRTALLSPVSFALAIVQVVTALAYGIAGFHKLNSDFTSARRSCGAGLVVHYLLQRGLRLRGWPWYAAPLGIYVVIITELALPGLLLIAAFRVAGLPMAIILSTAFGLLAHLHFSVVMFAGLASFLPQRSLNEFLLTGQPTWLLYAIGIVAGVLFGNYLPYRHVELAKLNHIAFAMLSAAMALYVVRNGYGTPLFMAAFRDHPLAFCIFILVFLANGAAPYFGVKQDFSLAMFSNLRADYWNHFIMPRPRWDLSPRYVFVEPVGLEQHSDVTQALEEHFIDRAQHKYSIGYVHEVLRQIERELRWPEPIALDVTESLTGERLRVCSRIRGNLRLTERVSVFPHALPLDPSTPVLS